MIHLYTPAGDRVASFANPEDARRDALARLDTGAPFIIEHDTRLPRAFPFTRWARTDGGFVGAMHPTLDSARK